jgi:hypothetical protein
MLQLAKNAPPAEALDVNDIFAYRAKLNALKEARKASFLPLVNPAYEEEDRQIPMRDGVHITIRIHRPKQPPADGSPVFVVYRGGGFVFGDLDSEVVLCRQWTELGGVAVNVDYRLSPEHPFPGPVYDAFDALKWVRNISIIWRKSANLYIDCCTYRRTKSQSGKRLYYRRHKRRRKLQCGSATSLPGRGHYAAVNRSVSVYSFDMCSWRFA